MMKNGTSMRQKEVIRYALLVGKKWVFWIFFLLDLVAVIVQFIYPQLKLPGSFFGILALVGFFWASYQVHKDILHQTSSSYEVKNQATIEKYDKTIESMKRNFENTIQEYSSALEKLTGTSKTSDLTPKIFISLMEGSEYIYSLEAPDDNEPYEVPRGSLNIHLRLENVGFTVIDVLTITANFDYQNGYPFIFGIPDAIKEKNETIIFPLHMSPNSIFLCNLRVPLIPDMRLNNAQFAAGLRKYIEKQDYLNLVKTGIEVLDFKGNMQTFSENFTFSVRPLCDLYITQWQDLSQFELIRLIGIETGKKEA